MRRAGAAATAVAVGVLVACGSPTSTEPSGSAPAPTSSSAASSSPASPSRTQAPAPIVEITITEAGGVIADAQLRPGPYQVQVTCARSAVPTLLEPIGGYSRAMLLTDLGPQTSDQGYGAAATRLDRSTRSLGGADCAPDHPARFATTLQTGTYWWAALPRSGEGLEEPQVVTADGVATLTVSVDPVTGTLPEPDATAVASDARSWDLPDRLPASGTLLLRNPGENSHALRLELAPDGVSAQEWLEATRLGRGAGGVGSARLSPDTELLWTYDLSPGPYVATDSSIGEYGYPQPNGAGAVIVVLE